MSAMGGSLSRMAGLVIATVVDVDDPEAQGRIQLQLSTMPEGSRTQTAWAPVAAPMAGLDRGAWLMPEVGDEALVGFVNGDPEHPYVVGFLWNGKDTPPSTHPRERLIRSLNGHTIRLIDEVPSGGAQGAVVIEDANGNVITMSNGKIAIKSVALLALEAPTITLSGPTDPATGVPAWLRIVTPNGNPI